MIYLNDNLTDFSWENALPQLSEQRREQVLKFKYEMGRKTCAAVYLLLCEGLRKEFGYIDKPVFGYWEHGKPYILDNPEIHFNMSHCREAAVCVVNSRPVGIDIESFRSFKESLVRYTMNDDEVDRIMTAERQDVEFIKLWTMKEAVLKLSGEGISRDLKTLLTGREHIETTVNMEKKYVCSVIYG